VASICLLAIIVLLMTACQPQVDGFKTGEVVSPPMGCRDGKEKEGRDIDC
jgi:hypothetical protein